MNIFEQYGIRDVADVTLYSIHKKKDGSGEVYYVPALHFDTLKVSTSDLTADGAWAEGGKGNDRFIKWDHSRRINVNLEDALCTPASLGLCWGGVLSADWKDGQISYNADVCHCNNPVKRLTRFEKNIYPHANRHTETISSMLPKMSSDPIDDGLRILERSSVVDGTLIQGHGTVMGHSYGWRMAIESTVKSIAVVPDRFFDIKGRSYPIDQNRKVSVTSLPTYVNYKDAVIYKINSNNPVPPRAKIIFDDAMEGGLTQMPPISENVVTPNEEENVIVDYAQNRTVTSLVKPDGTGHGIINDTLGGYLKVVEQREPCEGDYLALIVDNNDEYYALIGIDSEIAEPNNMNAAYSDDRAIVWYKPKTPIIVSQFKGIDMWLRFDSINAMIYYLITKYNEDICSIIPVEIFANENDPDWGDGDGDWAVNKQITQVMDKQSEESKRMEGKLWAFVDPRTYRPYQDDYWFHQGEPYYIASFTMSAKNKRLKANRITVKSGQWPGMYMLVGESYIRPLDGTSDEHLQIKFPLCKVTCEQSLELTADGDPVVFDLKLEVATPKGGDTMEITAYETANRLVRGEDGCYYEADGSTEVLSE